MYRLYNGDCLELMKDLAPGSVDMVLCDLPYGTTACKWDTVVDFTAMWERYAHVTKSNAAIVLTASQPFTSALVMSNTKLFKYCWAWVKTNCSGFANAKKQPLRTYEDIAVFYREQSTYNPQGIVRLESKRIRTAVTGDFMGRTGFKDGYAQEFSNYPKNVLNIASERGTEHPTQKPVGLMEYLIRTYTNEGDTVLDNCMGSGTTGVACANTGRTFIGMEKDTEHGYYAIAERRISEAYAQVVTPTQVATPIAPQIPSQLPWQQSPAGEGYILRISDIDEAFIGQIGARRWEVTACIAGQKYRGERAELHEAFTVADNLVVTKAPHYAQAAQ